MQRHDAARRRRARAGAGARRRSRRAHDAVPARAREIRRGRARRCRRRLHAGTKAPGGSRRRRRQRAIDPLREHPRDGRLVGAGARCHAEDRRAAGDGRAPGSRPGALGQLRVGRTIADRRSHGGGVALGRRAEGPAGSHGARHRPRDGQRTAGRTRVSRVFGRIEVAQRLAGRLRRRMVAGQPDRPRRLHALQRVHPRMPGTGDRLELPDRPRPLPRPPHLRRRVRRGGRDRLRPAGHAARRALRHRPRPARGAVDQAAPAAAGLFRAGRRRGRAGQGRHGNRDADRRIREAEVLQLQGVDLRAQPLAKAPAARNASTSARRRRYAPTATRSSWSRTCASDAAHARPFARRARSRTRIRRCPT